MPQNAWSLLVFTLLSQMSVGTFCVAELLNYSYTKEFGYEALHPLRLSSRLFVFAAAILAGVFSIFHLKKWAHAYHAFNNLKTSWVSKEMVLFFLFISCVVLLALMSWRKIEAHLLQHSVSIAGIICGIALIFSMAKIYMLPTIPVWDAWTTPGLFLLATFLLGCLAVACLYTAFLASSESSSLMENIREPWSRKTLPNLAKLLLVLIVLGILITGFFAYTLIVVAEEYGIKIRTMSPDKHVLLSLIILFYVLGWVLLFLYLKKSYQMNGLQEKSNKLVYGAFIFIGLAEIVGRYLFYVSYYRIGL